MSKMVETVNVRCPKCHNPTKIELTFSGTIGDEWVPSWKMYCNACNLTKSGSFKLWERIIFYIFSFLIVGFCAYVAGISASSFSSVKFILVISFIILVILFTPIPSLITNAYLRQRVLGKIKKATQ